LRTTRAPAAPAAAAPAATAPAAVGPVDESLELRCRAAAAAISALARESDACAHAIAMAFPDSAAATAAGVQLPAAATAAPLPVVCKNGCVWRAAAVATAAARNCSAAWAAEVLASERTRAAADGVLVLGGGGVEVGRFRRLLALADAGLQLSTVCMINRDGQAQPRSLFLAPHVTGRTCVLAG
jgi:hypothetical protein